MTQFHPVSISRYSTKLWLLCMYDKKINSNVGGFVKNVPGGKYQFGDTCIIDQNLAGREVMGSLYSSLNSYDDDDEDTSSVYLNPKEELPQWAKKIFVVETVTEDDTNTNTNTSSMTVTANNIQDILLTIRNEERSWEKFYAFIFPFEKRSEYRVWPETGVLAPRGGAANVCDENKPYLDTADLRILPMKDTYTDTDIDQGQEHVDEVRNNFWIIIATEEKTWKFKLETETNSI